jgi:hypothetical protein
MMEVAVWLCLILSPIFCHGHGHQGHEHPYHRYNEDYHHRHGNHENLKDLWNHQNAEYHNQPSYGGILRAGNKPLVSYFNDHPIQSNDEFVFSSLSSSEASQPEPADDKQDL